MQKKQKHILWVALVIVMVLALSAASAAPTQTFDALMTDYGITPEDAQAHSLAVAESAEALGVAISVDGIYYDGDRLLIGWKTENLQPEQPVLVLYTNVRLGGISVEADADYPLSLWWPEAFGLFVTGDPINGLMKAFYSENAKDFLLQGTQEVTADFTVKRPQKPIVIVDADVLTPYEDKDTETDRQSMLAALEACGVTIAQPDEMDVQTWMDNGYLVVNYGGEFLNTEGTTNDMVALNGEDLLDADIVDITLSFTVDFDALAGN